MFINSIVYTSYYWSATTTWLTNVIFILVLCCSYFNAFRIIHVIIIRICTSIWHTLYAHHSLTCHGACVISLYPLGLKILNYFCCNMLKHTCYVVSTFCWRLEKDKAMLLGKGSPLACIDLALMLRHIHFISY